MRDLFTRLSPLELALGHPLGVPAPRLDRRQRPGGARRELECAVRRDLEGGNVYVAFSGGRDSAAILAVAVHVARMDGLPLPTPVTLVYPGVPAADEAQWQALVLTHLGLSERLVVTVSDQERALGVHATTSLRRFGVLWPAALHGDPIPGAVGAGATVLTGEGGDEVLGFRRVTPWTVALRGRRLQGSGHVRELLSSLVGPGRRFGPLSAWDPSVRPAPWLRGPAVHAFRAEVGRAARTPWRYDVATRSLKERRMVDVLVRNAQAMAEQHGVRLQHPLLAPRFLDALATDGGRWGFRGRTDTMRFLFADLLPDAVLSRSSKAWFSEARFGEGEREFARHWDGSGVDTRYVDPHSLRDFWLSPAPKGSTTPLLHVAWLATTGADPLGDHRALRRPTNLPGDRG